MMEFITKATIGYLTLMGVIVCFKFSYFVAMPTDHWFFYHDFYPTKSEYVMGEPITFISEADIYRPVKIEWTDILRCKYDGIYQYASVYESSYIYPERSIFNGEGASWVWQGPPVQRPTTCYADSTACAVLPFGIMKCQQGITEERFNLVSS